jgi:hypothetical protein
MHVYSSNVAYFKVGTAVYFLLHSTELVNVIVGLKKLK